MRPYDQIALITFDIADRIKRIPAIYLANDYTGAETKDSKWIHDTVHAVHVFGNHLAIEVGKSFTVQLAFNYQIIPGRELELIHLVEGSTAQFYNHGGRDGLSHLGYHIPNNGSLKDEIVWWNRLGYKCAQVSMTTDHQGTPQRYLYAFIDTRTQIGAWTKVIYRVSGVRRIEDCIQEFADVNKL